MKKIFLIRILVALYFLLFVCTKISEHYMVIPTEAEEYSQTLYVLFNNPFGSIVYLGLGLIGYALEFIGLVFIFFSRHFGIYWLLIGTALSFAISVVLSNPNNYPFLQSELTNSLFGATCAVWGALVMCSLTFKAHMLKANA
jgi:hypothetical protein